MFLVFPHRTIDGQEELLVEGHGRSILRSKHPSFVVTLSVKMTLYNLYMCTALNALYHMNDVHTLPIDLPNVVVELQTG